MRELIPHSIMSQLLKGFSLFLSVFLSFVACDKIRTRQRTCFFKGDLNIHPYSLTYLCFYPGQFEYLSFHPLSFLNPIGALIYYVGYHIYITDFWDEIIKARVLSVIMVYQIP